MKRLLVLLLVTSLWVATLAPAQTVVRRPIVVPAGGGAPVFVNSNKHLRQSTPSTDVTLAATTGNCIVVSAGLDSGTDASISVADTASNTYTDGGSGKTIQGSAVGAQTFVAKNVTGGSLTITVTFSISSENRVWVSQFSNCSATAPVDKFAAASGASGTPDSGSQTTTVANEIIYGVALSEGGTGIGSGFTLIDDSDDEVNEYKTVSSTGSYSAFFTSVSGAWVAQMVTLKP